MRPRLSDSHYTQSSHLHPTSTSQTECESSVFARTDCESCSELQTQPNRRPEHAPECCRKTPHAFRSQLVCVCVCLTSGRTRSCHKACFSRETNERLVCQLVRRLDVEMATPVLCHFTHSRHSTAEASTCALT